MRRVASHRVALRCAARRGRGQVLADAVLLQLRDNRTRLQRPHGSDSRAHDDQRTWTCHPRAGWVDDACHCRHVKPFFVWCFCPQAACAGIRGVGRRRKPHSGQKPTRYALRKIAVRTFWMGLIFTLLSGTSSPSHGPSHGAADGASALANGFPPSRVDCAVSSLCCVRFAASLLSCFDSQDSALVWRDTILPMLQASRWPGSSLVNACRARVVESSTQTNYGPCQWAKHANRRYG